MFFPAQISRKQLSKVSLTSKLYDFTKTNQNLKLNLVLFKLSRSCDFCKVLIKLLSSVK